MDIAVSDADFDSYWEDESRNKNRNRIRVGRQYQAIVPSVLKPGETDGRRLEDLETLKWKPNEEINDQQLDRYITVAKAVSLFAKAINTCNNSGQEPERCLQTALRGLSDFVTSHHPRCQDDGCQVSKSGEHSPKQESNPEWTSEESDLFAKALEDCGKNFGAIKKEFLPWKPVKSLIEYYYCGKEEKANCSAEPDNNTSPTTANSKQTNFSPQADVTSKSPESSTTKELEVAENRDTPSVADDDMSTVGYLKFYLGGNLVLKLDAQQESSQKFNWVQARDSPKVHHASRKVRRSKQKVCSSQDNSEDASDCDSVPIPEAKKAKIRSQFAMPLPKLSPKPPWTPPVGKFEFDRSDGKCQALKPDCDETFPESCSSSNTSPPLKTESCCTKSDSPFSLDSPSAVCSSHCGVAGKTSPHYNCVLPKSQCPSDPYSIMLPLSRPFASSHEDVPLDLSRKPDTSQWKVVKLSDQFKVPLSQGEDGDGEESIVKTRDASSTNGNSASNNNHVPSVLTSPKSWASSSSGESSAEDRSNLSSPVPNVGEQSNSKTPAFKPPFPTPFLSPTNCVAKETNAVDLSAVVEDTGPKIMCKKELDKNSIPNKGMLYQLLKKDKL